MTWVTSAMSMRGFHVVNQDCRGTGESGGTTELLAHEHTDGADTVSWIRAQRWAQANPKVGMWGISFLGICIYAALSGGAAVDAVMPVLSSSNFYSLLRPGGPPGHGGGFALGLMTRWHYLTYGISPNLGLLGLAQRASPGALRRGTCHAFESPMCQMDSHVIRTCAVAAKTTAASGGTTPLGKMIETHLLAPPHDAFWQARTYRFCERDKAPIVPADAGVADAGAAATAAVRCTTPPAFLIGGWYDMFLGELLGDYHRFRAAERSHPTADHGESKKVYLTVGPWKHFDSGPAITAFREALWWFGDVLAGRKEKGVSRPSSSGTSPSGTPPRRSSGDAATAIPRHGSGDRSAGGGLRSALSRVRTLGAAERESSDDETCDAADVSCTVVGAAPHRPNRRRVMVYVLGLRRHGKVLDKTTGRRSKWAEFDEFPPPETYAVRVPLAGGGALGDAATVHALLAAGTAKSSTDAAVAANASRSALAGVPQTTTRYMYDPGTPAPTVGGTDFSPDAGKCDLAALESRSDVAIWTTSPLVSASGAGVVVIGPVSCRLAYIIDSDTVDFVVRLSYIHPDEPTASVFVCEGYRRVVLAAGNPASEQYTTTSDGRRRSTVDVSLWATALYVPPRARLRVSVTSSSHPKYTRNYGSTEVDAWVAAPISSGTAPAAHTVDAAGVPGARRVSVDIIHGSSSVSLPVNPSIQVV